MNEIQRISERQHTWGVWVESMDLQMMWYSTPGPDPVPLPQNPARPSPAKRMQWGIPSWSWLESEEPVRFVTPADHSSFRQSCSAIAYPGGTVAVSALQCRLVQPPAARRQGGVSASSPSPAQPDLKSEILVVLGRVRTGYIEPHPELGRSMRKQQVAADLRLGPIAMLACLGISSTPSFQYRLLQKTPSSNPGIREEMGQVGYCTAEEHHIGNKISYRASGPAGDQSRPALDPGSTSKWPMEVACLLVSNNAVLESGRSWRNT